MRVRILFVFLSSLLISCGTEKAKQEEKVNPKPIVGTWQLIRGTLIEKGDTTVTDYTKNTSFIKVINDSHFAFLQHDLNKGKDSAVFVAGGGTYTLKDNTYTEYLEYCSARDWEGNNFNFTISIEGDTLVQRGIEKVEGTDINRENIEKYIKVKP
ncbi:lipocalin-like domain-containing protein [Adhaeribacter radiodurans]|uniref:Lipocalin family protein n=1 Tax=Adhaeribacter radiodurans TaxID=2745197 RepID=A0A7L7L3G5_9BACT|nr:lipocalin family protein [Adhaeribacter radiodurans]QMU27310.1 lipocalin family protein [Adhaeribacter radiodurans]